MANYKNVSAKEACDLVKANSGKPDFAILDVRTPEEFAKGRIPGAINIDVIGRAFEQKLDELDRKKAYLVYCRSGNRSLFALPVMYRLGFETVYHLQAGIVEYADEKCPMISGFQPGRK